MYVNDNITTEKEVTNCFATYFEGKVDKIVKNANIDLKVYNGTRKLAAAGGDFMTPVDVYESVKQCIGFKAI